MAVFQQKFQSKKTRRKPIPVILLKSGRGSLGNGNQPAPRSTVDYKNTKLLVKFISPQGKILSRRSTGLTAKQQRVVATAIKRARMSGLLPFVNLEISGNR
jgi:small subunit ribosomal protein S18